MVRSKKSKEVPEQAASPSPLSEKLWSMDQVAEWLNVSTWTIRRYMRECGLPYFKQDEVIRFDKYALERWFNERCNQSA